MLRIMGRENMGEWGGMAAVEHETVKAVIQAYADGKIELPAMGAKVSRSNVSNAPSVLTADAGRGDAQHPYTRLCVATFLGWTRKSGDNLKPNYACREAFAALELIERKLAEESDYDRLSRVTCPLQPSPERK